MARMWERPVLRTNVLYALLPGFVMMSTPNAYGLALEVYGRGPQGLAAMEVITSAGWIVGGALAVRIITRVIATRIRWCAARSQGCASSAWASGAASGPPWPCSPWPRWPTWALWWDQ